MMKQFSSNKEIQKKTKLLILLLFIAVVIFLNLLKAPFFILIGVIFFKGLTAAVIISVLIALFLVSIYLILQRNKFVYFVNYLCIALGINTLISLISYSILRNEVILNVKHYYLASYSVFLSVDQIANIFIITNISIILLYGSIVYFFQRVDLRNTINQ